MATIVHHPDPRDRAVPRVFQEDGLSFRYPDNWTLEREGTDNGWTVLLQSPSTAFLLVTVDDSLPDPEDMVHSALEAMRSDYPDLEAETRIGHLAGQPAVGYDISFFNLDLTNTCWTRAFTCDAGTVLVLCQAADLDLEQYEAVLRAVCTSLRVDED
jgi:hypothetical protein